jgi:uncharacterized damage-inducible protein DinB
MVQIEDLEEHMKDHFIRLIQFNDWANRRIMTALSLTDKVDPKALSLLNHVIVVQGLLLDRIIGRTKDYKLWENCPVSELLGRSEDSTGEWMEYLIKLTPAELGRKISYVSVKGTPYENMVSDLITTVVNHSVHHRAQVSLLIRQAGKVPPMLDYICFARGED